MALVDFDLEQLAAIMGVGGCVGGSCDALALFVADVQELASLSANLRTADLAPTPVPVDSALFDHVPDVAAVVQQQKNNRGRPMRHAAAQARRVVAETADLTDDEAAPHPRRQQQQRRRRRVLRRPSPIQMVEVMDPATTPSPYNTSDDTEDEDPPRSASPPSSPSLRSFDWCLDHKCPCCQKELNKQRRPNHRFQMCVYCARVERRRSTAGASPTARKGGKRRQAGRKIKGQRGRRQ